MKNIYFLFAFLFSASAIAEIGIVYRGRLQATSGSVGTAARRIEVRLYRDEAGGVCKFAVTNMVRPDINGNFQIPLEGPAVNEAIANGEANYIGITIGENGREILPRSRVLAVPRAYHAKTAETLAPGASVHRLDAELVSAGTTAVTNSMRIRKSISFIGGDGAVPVEDVTVTNKLGEVRDLIIESDDISLFSDQGFVEVSWGGSDWADENNKSLGQTNFRCKLPYTGIYFVTTVSKLRTNVLPHTPSPDLPSWRDNCLLDGWDAPGFIFIGYEGDEVLLPIRMEGAKLYARPFNWSKRRNR